MELRQQLEKLENDTSIEKLNAYEEATKVERENEKLNVQRQMQIDDLHSKADTKIEQAKIALIKE